MMKALPYKTKQLLVVLLKFCIVVGAFYFIYKKLTDNNKLEISSLLDFLYKGNLFSIENCLLLIFLTGVNWLFEILKWQTLVSSVQSISFKNAAEQSLGALTASLLTPNRIGEYGAKAIYFEKPLRKKIMLLNFIGNMMQMTTTMIFGYVAFFFFAFNYSLELAVVKIALSILAFSLILIAVFYFLNKIQFSIKGFSFIIIFEFVREISFDIKIKAFLFSMSRYLIFSFQFYILLQIFEVDIGYFSAIMVISTMYLLSSIIPSIFIFDVIIKGSVAVYLFSMLGVNELTILCIVTLMWILNFVIPSLIGSYYVLNFKLLKAEQVA